ncbi:gastric triacylglycerol lipase-like [Daphnia pulex]|uniref:gastric triacylglycerol lipase-like n=1 Tax=Daphnia pulex TaxID=6669 RepID=UPI001EE09725|nr:gastric triacylglycerol lipase-like [Daphnia pulex]
MYASTKDVLIVSIVCYILASHGNEEKVINFVTNSFKLITDLIQHTLQPRIERNVFQQPESFMTTPEIIAYRGYPIEIHHVVTDDGYILELHRIPFGSCETCFKNRTIRRKPVFLQHGMMTTDHTWLFSSSNNSLAYILADNGYDVWLGNSRGNVYSRKHVSLNPDADREYWNYSWDEMGKYDIPASIDYVLNTTEENKLAAYFGYSLGVGTFLMGAIQHSELNDKVEVMIGLGPTVNVAHLNNFFRYMAPFVKIYQFLQELLGIGEVHRTDGLFHLLTRLLCETSHFGVEIGKHMLFQIFGYSETYEKNFAFRSSGHYPGGGSANTMAHFFQNINSGDSFLHFDYGSAENLKRYGTTYPPEYNLTKVTVPVYLVYGDNDPFAPIEDLSWLIERLSCLKAAIRVDSPGFTHGDFIWSTRLAELVNLPVIDLIPSNFH